MSDPWQEEPDNKDFQAMNYRCALRRGPTGAWCGYVGLPREHPLFGKSYSDDCTVILQSRWESRKNKPAEIDGAWKVSAITVMCADPDNKLTPDLVFEVHGGITYADEYCPPRGDRWDFKKRIRVNRWWFGFDCSHAGDLMPKYMNGGGVYRTIDYAEAELRNLARQLKDVGSNTP